MNIKNEKILGKQSSPPFVSALVQLCFLYGVFLFLHNVLFTTNSNMCYLSILPSPLKANSLEGEKTIWGLMQGSAPAPGQRDACALQEPLRAAGGAATQTQTWRRSEGETFQVLGKAEEGQPWGRAQ